MKARIIKRPEAIRETRTGWLNETTGQSHKTAGGAWRAVKRRAKAITKAAPDAVVIQVITWTPLTRIGTAIIKSFQTP